MIDTRRLLDQFLGGGQPADQGGGQFGQPPASNAGTNGGLLGQAGGVFGQVGTFARNNPLLAGGAAGGLAALVLGSKGGREIGKDVVKYGGLALIGGLAYKAYRDYQASQGQGAPAQVPQAQPQGRTSVPVLPPPQDSGFAPANAPQGEASLAETLLIAMVSAAKADGHIDAEERGRIYERLEQGGLEADELAFLKRELAAPVDMERLVRAATSKEVAVEIYAASVMAIRADTPAEKGYLAMLAGRLGLEPDLVATIENTIAGGAVPA